MTPPPPGFVSLRGSASARVVPPGNVLFTFPDGRLDYDCVSCGALCCRGYGFEVEAGDELSRHITDHPGLALFIGRGRGTTRTVKNCAPGCFFLSEGLCRIQADRGYLAKPETCRFFPFNYFRQSGSYLVVSPHSWLCPLRVLPHGSYSMRSSHEALLEELSRHGIGTDVPTVTASTGDLAWLIGLERRLLAHAAGCNDCDYGDFTASQLGLTLAAMSPDGVDVPPPVDEVRTFRRLLADVLGLPNSCYDAVNTSLANTLVAVTPSLRAELAFQTARSLPCMTVPVERRPLTLLVLYSIAAAAQHAGMGTVTYQTLSKLYRDHSPLTCLLTFVDCRMKLRRTANVEWPVDKDSDNQRGLATVLKALLSDEPPVLGTLLRDTAGASPMQRILFLRTVAERLGPGLETATPRRWGSLSELSARRPLRRVFLRLLSPDSLSAISEYRSRIR